ncbi:hypothetical protein ACOME3_007973 [Neoechinorhynchus agilis]
MSIKDQKTMNFLPDTVQWVHGSGAGAGDSFRIVINTDGFEPHQIGVRVENRKLHVSALREEALSSGCQSSKRMERSYEIPADVDRKAMSVYHPDSKTMVIEFPALPNVPPSGSTSFGQICLPLLLILPKYLPNILIMSVILVCRITVVSHWFYPGVDCENQCATSSLSQLRSPTTGTFRAFRSQVVDNNAAAAALNEAAPMRSQPSSVSSPQSQIQSSQSRQFSQPTASQYNYDTFFRSAFSPRIVGKMVIMNLDATDYGDKDISIKVEGTNLLKVEAQRYFVDKTGRSSRMYFYKDVTLPPTVDVRKLQAFLNSDGQLMIEVPLLDHNEVSNISSAMRTELRSGSKSVVEIPITR